MSNVTDLPQNVDLDLDAAERPRESVKEPFTVRLGGKVISMTDPEELDWQDLLEIEDPTDFLRFCVSDEDRAHIRKQKLEGWKLGRLMEAYMSHYGLDEKLADAQRAMGRQRRF